MTKTRKQLRELMTELLGDVHHGECFYDKEMLEDFLDGLNKMKELSVKYFNENQEEQEEDL